MEIKRRPARIELKDNHGCELSRIHEHHAGLADLEQYKKSGGKEGEVEAAMAASEEYENRYAILAGMRAVLFQLVIEDEGDKDVEEHEEMLDEIDIQCMGRRLARRLAVRNNEISLLLRSHGGKE